MFHLKMPPRSCTEQFARRYVDRPSPPYPGNQCQEGDRKMGNDGNWYVVSKPNVNGVKRWIRETHRQRRRSSNRVPNVPRAPAPRQERIERIDVFRLMAQTSDVSRNVILYSQGKRVRATIFHTRPQSQFIVYNYSEELFYQISPQNIPVLMNFQDPINFYTRGYKIWATEGIPNEFGARAPAARAVPSSRSARIQEFRRLAQQGPVARNTIIYSRGKRMRATVHFVQPQSSFIVFDFYNEQFHELDENGMTIPMDMREAARFYAHNYRIWATEGLPGAQ